MGVRQFDDSTPGKKYLRRKDTQPYRVVNAKRLPVRGNTSVLDLKLWNDDFGAAA